MKMHNLHLLIFGSTEEEIRANAAKALDDAFKLHSSMGGRANCLGDEYEFEFREEDSMWDIIKSSVKEHKQILRDEGVNESDEELEG